MIHRLLPHQFYKVQLQFLACIPTLLNPRIKILKISLSHSRVQKAEEERNQAKVNKNLNSNLNHLTFPPEPEEQYKEANNYYHNENSRGNNLVDPIGANKVVVEDLLEVLNHGEGDSKIIIEANTKTTADNLTLPTEDIAQIIIAAIIEVEVDVAMVIIITEVMAMEEAIIEAIIITNTTNITHMMIAHR